MPMDGMPVIAPMRAGMEAVNKMDALWLALLLSLQSFGLKAIEYLEYLTLLRAHKWGTERAIV